MFGENILNDSLVEFKKGDTVQSRYSQRKGKILDLHIDQMHATVRWENGAEQKVTTGQLIKINAERYKAANDVAAEAFEEALTLIVGSEDISNSVRNAEFSPFSRGEILEIGDIMREAGISISPEWITDELSRRGFRIVS